jgi:hypothetical protein
VGAAADSILAMPGEVWNMLEDWQQTMQIQSFVQSAINAGNQIVLTMDPSQALQGTGFGTEVEYLIQKGYTFVQTGSSWVAVKN